MSLPIALILALAAPVFAPQETATLELETTLEEIRSRHELPGLAGAILVGDELVAVAAVGLRERGSEEAFTAGDRVHLGSCTKSMTATVAAMLEEEGLLRWDSTLSEVFPERVEDGQARVPGRARMSGGQGSFNVLHADPEGAKEGYALGWAVAERSWADGPVLNHGGSNTAWFCVTWIGPLKDFAVLAASNQGGPAAAQACDELSLALIRLHQQRAEATER